MLTLEALIKYEPALIVVAEEHVPVIISLAAESRPAPLPEPGTLQTLPDVRAIGARREIEKQSANRIARLPRLLHILGKLLAVPFEFLQLLLERVPILLLQRRYLLQELFQLRRDPDPLARIWLHGRRSVSYKQIIAFEE